MLNILKNIYSVILVPLTNFNLTRPWCRVVHVLRETQYNVRTVAAINSELKLRSGSLFFKIDERSMI